MRTNRFLGFIMSVAALAFAATACDDKKEDLGAPSVEVEKSEISFEKTGGTETVQVTATRDWKATTEQDWISIGPREGERLLEGRDCRDQGDGELWFGS